MDFPIELLINAIIAGLLLGGFDTPPSPSGISISFGILDIVNIAHPAFIILGVLHRLYRQPDVRASIRSWSASSCCRRSMRSGSAVYQVYYVSVRDSTARTRLRGLAFFFGLLFVTEVIASFSCSASTIVTCRRAYIELHVALGRCRSAAAHAGARACFAADARAAAALS